MNYRRFNFQKFVNIKQKLKITTKVTVILAVYFFALEVAKTPGSVQFPTPVYRKYG